MTQSGPERSPRTSRRVPGLTYALIGLCALVFGAGKLWPGIYTDLIFAPWLGQLQPYRFLSSALLHADVWHLVLNMWALWVVGQWLEPLLGRWRFLSLYVLSALGGNVAVTLLANPAGQDWFTYVVGASGAVFGLFAAIFVISARFKGDMRPILVLLAINFGFGFLVEGISWQSHLGGMITGGLVTLAYSLSIKPRQSKALIDIISTLVIAGILVGLAFFAYA